MDYRELAINLILDYLKNSKYTEQIIESNYALVVDAISSKLENYFNLDESLRMEMLGGSQKMYKDGVTPLSILEPFKALLPQSQSINKGCILYC